MKEGEPVGLGPITREMKLVSPRADGIKKHIQREWVGEQGQNTIVTDEITEVTDELKDDKNCRVYRMKYTWKSETYVRFSDNAESGDAQELPSFFI